jgi:serine/threonine protein kinase
MHRKKQIKRGGGYDSKMAVTPTGLKVLSGLSQEDDPKHRDMTFTVTSTTKPTTTTTTYKNIRYIGRGTYGKVYLVEETQGTGNRFVIKIQTKYPSIQKEAEDLDRIMHGVTGKCKYVAISQGVTDDIGHAVFPYLGSTDLEKMVVKKEMTIVVPKIISNVIRCLNVIHSQGYSHLDIKLANIVFDDKNQFAHIIDYGLSMHEDDITLLTIGDIRKVNVGDYQLSVEMIIARIFVLYDTLFTGDMGRLLVVPETLPPRPHFSVAIPFRANFYDPDISGKIKQTTDNFGLFWLILGLLTFGNDNRIYIRFIPNCPPYRDRTPTTDIDMFCKLFFFFYSLSLNSTRQPTDFMKKMDEAKFCNVSTEQEVRNYFISSIREFIPPRAFKFWFNDNESRFNEFMENVILLVHVDPEVRITPIQLLEDRFFQHVFELWDAEKPFLVDPEQFIKGSYPDHPSRPDTAAVGGKRKNKKRNRTRKRKSTRIQTQMLRRYQS